jgi:hypothetical protein
MIAPLLALLVGVGDDYADVTRREYLAGRYARAARFYEAALDRSCGLRVMEKPALGRPFAGIDPGPLPAGPPNISGDVGARDALDR